MSQLKKLASWVSGLTASEVPEAVFAAARLCVLDTVGAAAGARDNPQLKSVTEAYLKICGAAETAGVWGGGLRGPLLTCVFLNAMAGHTLEMDDVHAPSKTHIGTVVIPAAWGMAEYLGKSGREFLLAVICGYEVMSRVGEALGVSSHRNRGWHVTGTAGTFGAAAACGKLMGLQPDRMVSALGMAGTQSGGLWAFLADGASCKVLHPARAAASGCEAALLAGAGMTGPESILDAKDGGLLAAMSDACEIGRVSEKLGETWKITEVDKKPYPCCRSTHCAIDAALKLRGKGLDPDEIDRAEVQTYLVGLKQCGMSPGSICPRNAVDAKFSTPYVAACAFLYGAVDLASFRQDAIDDPGVRRLAARISVVEDSGFTAAYPAHWGCRMRVFCRDGRVLSEEVRDASGSAEEPLDREAVIQKTSGMLGQMPEPEKQRFIRSLLELDSRKTLPGI